MAGHPPKKKLARTPGRFLQRFAERAPEPDRLAESIDDDTCYHDNEEWSDTEDAPRGRTAHGRSTRFHATPYSISECVRGQQSLFAF